MQRAKRLLKDNKMSSKILDLAGGDPEKITLKMVIAAAQADDKAAVALFAEAGDYLGAKIAFLINLFNPDAVVLGRGIEKFGEAFMTAVRTGAKKWAYEETLKIVRIVPTSLEEDSIACGAAALVMQQVFARI